GPSPREENGGPTTGCNRSGATASRRRRARSGGARSSAPAPSTTTDPRVARRSVDPLTPAVVAGLLQSAVTTLRAELTALPESVLTYHPAPGEWCAKEIVGHLIE